MAAIIKKFITNDGTIRASAVICTDLMKEMQVQHKTLPIASAALGRSLIAAGLMASFHKDGTRVALYFKGDGPLGNIFAEGSSDGGIRGYVANPQVHLPSKNGKLNVGGGVGKGILSITMSAPHEKQPYSGSVEIQTGEVGEDVAYYLFQSAQIPSVVALGIFIESDNTVSSAGGVMIQAMPGVTDQTLSILEKRVLKMRSISEMLKSGCQTDDLVLEVLEDFSIHKLDLETEMVYRCDCSSRKVERVLLMLGADELDEMVKKGQSTDVRCDFCGKSFNIDIETLKALANLARQKN